jgi:hypothetical protein
MKKTTLLVITILFLIPIYSQKYELGKVTIDELKETVYSKDTSAVAAILYNIGNSHFEYSEQSGFYVVTDVETKIKIYKKEGYEWANKEVNFYKSGSGDHENVVFSKAVTYNLVNGAIEKTKTKSENEFTETRTKNWSVKKLVMPNVKVGSVIEYKYSISSPFTTQLYEWDFQEKIPVAYSKFSVGIPEYYNYNIHRKGFLYPKEEKNQTTKSINFISKERVSNRGTVSTIFSTDNIKYIQKINIHTLENIPALKEESYVNNINNYKASVVYELSSTQFPNAMFKSYASTWEDVAKKIYAEESFGDELKKTAYFEAGIKTFVDKLSNNDEKIAAIFNYVKSTMNWNKNHGIFCGEGVSKAFKNKTGDVAEINLMLTSMLRYAGLNADPVLVSTRSHGISFFPSRTAFNYVICAVESQNGLVLLDATDKNAYPNILPIRDLNWFGRRIRKNGESEKINLMPEISSAENLLMMASIDETGKVTGQLRDIRTDYQAYNYRDVNGSLSQESYLEKLEKKYNGIEVSDYKIENDKELDKPLTETYSFKSNNAVEIIGGKMYFSPLLFLASSENPFKQEKREYPVDFVYPIKDKYTISLKIPSGFTVESLPKPISFVMDNNYGSFSFNITNTENQIQIQVNQSINTPIIPSKDYQTLQLFYKEMIAKETEKIVLKKV